MFTITPITIRAIPNPSASPEKVRMHPRIKTMNDKIRMALYSMMSTNMCSCIVPEYA